MQTVQVRRPSTAGWIRPIPMRTGHFPVYNTYATVEWEVFVKIFDSTLQRQRMKVNST